MHDVPDKLISAYLEGTLDQAQAEALSQWVQASKDNALYLASLTTLEHGLVKRSKMRSNRDILSELQQAEEAAPVVLSSMDEVPQTLHFEHSKTLTKNEYASALSYVIRHTFTPKRIAILATAAALMLGVILAITMLTAPSDTEQIAETPEQFKPAAQAVATLTAQHNAQWSSAGAASAPSASLSVGSELRAGDRLTLTAGFAEITTNDGAIAILQAPATLELLENNNAIRLESGKLVGICETESSKGFLVRTPHMDVIDLGTRFGVVASEEQASEVHVFEGEVQAAARSGHGAIPLQLHAGQSAKADASQQVLEVVAYDPTRFASLATDRLALPGTGVGLSPGQNDANWLITEINGKPLTDPLAPVVFNQKSFEKTARENLAYLPNDPAQSQWIMPPDLYRAGATQRYETRLDFSQIDPAECELLLRFIADSHVTSIQLNGVELEVPEHGSGPAFTEMTTLVIREGLVRGENRLAITVQRYRTEESADFWTGLRAELQLNQQGSPLEASP